MEQKYPNLWLPFILLILGSLKRVMTNNLTVSIMRNAFKNGELNATDIDQPVNYLLVYRLYGEFKNAV